MIKNRASVMDKLNAAVADKAAPVAVPDVSFRDFLDTQAKVKVGSNYVPYSMEGRPALALMTQWVDEILASGRPDCRIKAKGGAQWGKTVWAINLYGYLMGSKMLGVGYYLPDGDLVGGIVDTKFRPDVVDQIPWFASLLSIGKTINKSGKAVNRKGAIMATDGKQVSLGYFLGCNRVPTTYTHDVQIVDERDDINERNEKYLDGRLTSSQLRLRIDIGTARYDKAGMDKEFEDSTQHCAVLKCATCGDISPEDEWPGICRLQVGDAPSTSDPRLTLAGDFKASESGATVATHRPENIYYFACPHCGVPLDRNAVTYEPRRPEMAALGKYGVEVSQISTPAIDLIQIVAAWASAVADPDKMTAFRCDRWARPKSNTQGLDTGIMDRSRGDYALSVVPTGRHRFGGLDTGDRFWFVARESESAADKTFAWAEQISPTVAQSRIPQLFEACGLTCLFVDIGNEREIARTIVMLINGILDAPPLRPGAESGRIDFGDGLIWDGQSGGVWRGLKAAAVEFSGKRGCGLIHEIRRTQEDRAYPVIRANRDESIQRVVDEFLTYDDGLVSVVEGKVRTDPIMHMPSATPGCNAAVTVLQQHFISGSRKALKPDGKTLSFIDKVDNHYLLANAYSALAEQVAEASERTRSTPACQTVNALGHTTGGSRSRRSFL